YTPPVPKKIDAAKSAANSFLENMGNNDQSGLVSFANDVSLDQPLTNTHDFTKSAVDALDPDGATNIGDAIARATQELETNNNSQAVKVIILLTDGIANMPSGVGDPEDYALAKAQDAADENYKIFTVGLGSNNDIHEKILRDIADITSANYHHAPNGSNLKDIYDEIAWEICQYGSISGCKYNDVNNNGIIDQGEPTIQDWQVNLFDGTATTIQTVLDGCYTFAGLDDDNYIVTETIPTGWIQTYPEQGFYSITISNHNDEIDKNFANYQIPETMCGDGKKEGDEQCDDGNDIIGDGCYECLITYECSDNVDNDGDGQIDLDDPGCDSLTDNDETDLLPPQDIQHGDIIINEIMQNPSVVDDDYGEWIELYNTTQNSVDLIGCIITDNDSNSHIINNSLVVSIGDYVILGRSNDININGGVIVDYKYSNFSLGNSDDEIILTCNNGVEDIEIDRVEYTGSSPWPDPTGASMGFNPNLLNSDPKNENDIGSNWCESSTMWSGSAGDKGTPGAVNDSCGNTPPPSCASSISGKKYNGNKEDDVTLKDWEIELYNSQDLENPLATTTTDINGEYIFEDLCVGSTYIIKEVQQQGWEQIWPTTPDDTFYTETITAELPNLTNRDFSNMQIGPQSGDVIINELMWMGSSISTADEWIELKNTTSNQINFSETPWSIYKNDALMVIIDTGILEPNKYFLISNNDKDHSFSAGESALNITPDLIDSSISLDSSAVQYKLYNTADDSGDLIDTADNGLGDPLAGEYNKSEGIYKSMSRKSPPGDGTQAESWCNAGTQTNWDAGATELGTPGAENVCEGATPPPEFGSLKICKYEDADGSATTTDDQIALADWVFQIFDNTATSTATTTDNGCVIINELIPGDYRITENIKN
ncbi:lamin tail domain-containing protein, partial [Patescibacteria group bacterium]|nr:lamin tail domain-containing protein [Patescibacteria group bacterium]